MLKHIQNKVSTKKINVCDCDVCIFCSSNGYFLFIKRKETTVIMEVRYAEREVEEIKKISSKNGNLLKKKKEKIKNDQRK